MATSKQIDTDRRPAHVGFRLLLALLAASLVAGPVAAGAGEPAAAAGPEAVAVGPPTVEAVPGDPVQLDRRDARALRRQALRISRQVQRRHTPHGTVFDPVFADPESSRVVGYTHAGDSAIWTGHYVAAEAFRHAATGSGVARGNVRKAVAGLQRLVDVTGTGLLARAAVPQGSRWETALTEGESHQGIWEGRLGDQDWLWAGNTSRDQYSGVFFGLSVAYEHVREPGIRAEIRRLVGHLLQFLVDKRWMVVMPDGDIATAFTLRPEQQLAFLQVGRQVDPGRWSAAYEDARDSLAGLVELPILVETSDPHGSYFKFNLDAINLYTLIRLEEPGDARDDYMDAWETLRAALADHGNAHFDMIDRALRGPDAARDEAAVGRLLDWLQRPRRDVFVDRAGDYPACGDNRACRPLPVTERPSTDFLWQRSPFLLRGGGAGTVQGAGIDLILPYWMARHLGAI